MQPVASSSGRTADQSATAPVGARKGDSMNLLTTVAEIDKAIKSLHNRGQKLQTDSHVLACSVLAHVIQHGDIRVVARFLEAMPEMSRVNGLRQWFEKFGPVTFNGNVPMFNRTKVGDLESAQLKPYWRFAANEGKEYQSPDPAKVLESLAKKLAHDQKLTGTDWSEVILSLKTLNVQPRVAGSPLMIELRPN
jgi:hypothetical protein